MDSSTTGIPKAIHEAPRRTKALVTALALASLITVIISALGLAATTFLTAPQLYNSLGSLLLGWSGLALFFFLSVSLFLELSYSLFRLAKFKAGKCLRIFLFWVLSLIPLILIWISLRLMAGFQA